MTARKNTPRPSRPPKKSHRVLPLSVWAYLFSAASLIAAGAMIYVLVEFFHAN